MGEFLKGYVLKMIGGDGGCRRLFSGWRFSRPCSGVRQSDVFSKRGTAVLEAPEQKYASESRRAATSLGFSRSDAAA